jgi:signal transduction histidine kinase
MFNSLKFKIAATALILVSLIMTITTWRDIRDTEQQLLDSQKEKTVLLSDRIAHGIMVLMLNNRWKDLQTMMVSLAEGSNELREIRIFRPENGAIVVSSEPDEVGDVIYPEDRKKFEENSYDAFLIEKKEETYSSKLTPIRNQPACFRCHGTEKEVLGVLDIEISLSGVYSTIQKLKREHFIDAFIGFLLITGAFLFVVGFLIDRPISRMIRTIRKIENGDTSLRMNAHTKDEFGLLANSFDSMLQSLEAAKQEIEHCHLEQMQKASRLASLGEIVSGIAHEIKNPLTGISCAVQVLRSELSISDNNKAITSEILNQINRLDKIVKDLLSFAKPKPPEFLHAKINDVMEKTLFFVYPEARKQKITIETDIEMDFPEMRMDPDQIQQVCLNLMINALQATPPGGNLKVSVAQRANNKELKEKITTSIEPEKVLEISFRDSGKGIPPEDIQSIFEPFFTKKTKGTGLGLFISQKIVQEHGGEITVESEVGKGTTFTVYLPVMIIRPDQIKSAKSLFQNKGHSGR